MFKMFNKKRPHRSAFAPTDATWTGHIFIPFQIFDMLALIEIIEANKKVIIAMIEC